MNYQEASQLTRSEKITLVTCEASKPVKLFTNLSGSIYYKDVDYFVSNVLQNGIPLEVFTSSALDGPGQYYYDIKNKRVYVWCIGDGDPKSTKISLIYKFFFSNAPVILPYDLNSGESVEWLPLIRQIGSIGQQLDDQNVGVVLESQSNVEMINQGFFQNIFDSLIWENQNIKFYSWFKNIAITEAKKIFDGVVESKDYSPDKVNFKVKDYVFKLRNQVSLGTFSSLDGEVLDSIIGTPKRRIYGQIRQARAIPIDCTIEGYPLTGTVSITAGSDVLTGVGTDFRKELNQDDKIIFIVDNEEVSYSVNLIQNNTTLTLTNKANETLTNKSVTVDPEVPYRFKNRRWHLAGHKIRETKAIIQTVINARQFVVDNVSEFYSAMLSVLMV